MRLVKNMYGEGSQMFNLEMAQMRMDDTIHNGSWFNSQGEKLGWGDLSRKDIRNIAINLEEGERFFILSERDSYWAFTKIANNGQHVTDLASLSLGEDTVLKLAEVIVEPGKVLIQLDKFNSESRREETRSFWQQSMDNLGGEVQVICTIAE